MFFNLNFYNKYVDKLIKLWFNINEGGITMPNNINKIINQFVLEISNLLGERLKKVILYGSYARGDYDKNSDIDIMILTDLTDKEIIEYRIKVRELACDLELENDIMISPLVRNVDKYNQRNEVKQKIKKCEEAIALNANLLLKEIDFKDKFDSIHSEAELTNMQELLKDMQKKRSKVDAINKQFDEYEGRLTK